MIFKAEYFSNILWIDLYDYMRMYEWLICVEYDVYHDVMYFLLTWIVRNNMMLLNYMIKSMLVNTYMLIDCDIVGEYIYVDWFWYCQWLHICRVLVIAYMLNEWWWCGELFVWTYALLLSHMFMHTWLMVTDFISKM